MQRLDLLTIGGVTIRKAVGGEAAFQPISITVKAKWKVPLTNADAHPMRVPLTLERVKGRGVTADLPNAVEAVGLIHPSELSDLFAEVKLPPGRYRLRWALPGEEARGWTFEVLEDVHAPVRLFCAHGAASGSFHDITAFSTVKGEMAAVLGTTFLAPCCRDLLTHRRPSGMNEFALVFRQPIAHPYKFVGDRTTWTVRPGEYALVNPETFTTYPLQVKMPYQWRHLAIYQPFLRSFRDRIGFAKMLGGFAFAPGPHPMTPALTAALTTLEDALTHTEMIGAQPYVESAVHQFLLVLLRDHPNRLQEQWRRHGRRLPTDPRLKTAMDYFDRHYARALSVEAVAREAGLSVDRLRKMMLQQLGVSPTDYLATLRMEKAKALLQDSGLTVRAIAKAVGYADVRSFRRVFRARAGSNAGTFRQTPKS